MSSAVWVCGFFLFWSRFSIQQYQLQWRFFKCFIEKSRWMDHFGIYTRALSLLKWSHSVTGYTITAPFLPGCMVQRIWRGGCYGSWSFPSIIFIVLMTTKPAPTLPGGWPHHLYTRPSLIMTVNTTGRLKELLCKMCSCYTTASSVTRQLPPLLPVMVSDDGSQCSHTYSVAHQVDFLAQNVLNPARSKQQQELLFVSLR